MINISKQISAEKSFKNNNKNYQYADTYGKLLGKKKTKEATYLLGERSVLDIDNNTEQTLIWYSEMIHFVNNIEPLNVSF
jgi:hypothetical protein